MKAGAAAAHIHWALPPLPPGEGRGEGCLLLPPPLGEGWGRGSPAPFLAFRFAARPTTASPHPSPLPEGEGTRQVTTKLGAAYAYSVWPTALFNLLKSSYPVAIQKVSNAKAQKRKERKAKSSKWLPSRPLYLCAFAVK